MSTNVGRGSDMAALRSMSNLLYSLCTSPIAAEDSQRRRERESLYRVAG